MRRSEINSIIQEADAFIQSCKVALPPFAYWTPDEWHAKGPEIREIVETHLGWDITDFGSGDFRKCGLVLFTLRNGKPAELTREPGKVYAEKLLVVREKQVTPLHFHWLKMEDIINRGGGNLCLRLFNSTKGEVLDETSPVCVKVDSVERIYQPGEKITLHNGESICLTPHCYHEFWAEDGDVLAGEVSMVNDDNRDNRFLEAKGRFPEIEEDVPPLYLLCTDHERFYSGKYL